MLINHENAILLNKISFNILAFIVFVLLANQEGQLFLGHPVYTLVVCNLSWREIADWFFAQTRKYLAPGMVQEWAEGML